MQNGDNLLAAALGVLSCTIMPLGEDMAWDELDRLDPESVCRRSSAAYDRESETFRLTVFNQQVLFSKAERIVSAPTLAGEWLLVTLGPHLRLSALWYLKSACGLPPSGRLVKPDDLAGGDIYRHGSHVLPLDNVAGCYERDPEAFLKRGMELGGEKLGYADVSLRLCPLPYVPMAMLLWLGDDEFAARASLLFDSGCELQLPGDVLWSTAMMSVLVFTAGEHSGEG